MYRQLSQYSKLLDHKEYFKISASPAAVSGEFARQEHVNEIINMMNISRSRTDKCVKTYSNLARNKFPLFKVAVTFRTLLRATVILPFSWTDPAMITRPANAKNTKNVK